MAWASPGQKPTRTQPSELQDYIFANGLDENEEVTIRGPGLHAHRPQSDSGMTELDEKPQGSLQQLMPAAIKGLAMSRHILILSKSFCFRMAPGLHDFVQKASGSPASP